MRPTHDLHLQLIEGALDTIEAGLRRPLDLDQIARASGMSYWHFQRTFSALTGEPIGSYIRRRRLSSAARDLLRSRRRILEIALDYQFESHASFTRAFCTLFGLSPSAFRRGHPSFLATRPRLTGERLRRLQRRCLQPDIVELPALHLLGLSTRFIGVSSDTPNNTTVLPRLWQEFLSRLPEINPPARAPHYGAGDCLPSEARVDPDELQYLAGIRVTPPLTAPPGMVQWSVAPSRYARFVHRGSALQLGDTIESIYALWLPRSGFERGSSVDLERYDHRFSATSPDCEIDYFVPLAS